MPPIAAHTSRRLDGQPQSCIVLNLQFRIRCCGLLHEACALWGVRARFKHYLFTLTYATRTFMAYQFTQQFTEEYSSYSSFVIFSSRSRMFRYRFNVFPSLYDNDSNGNASGDREIANKQRAHVASIALGRSSQHH